MGYRYYDFGKFLILADMSVVSALRTLVFGFKSYHLDALGVSQAFVRRALKVLFLAKISRNPTAKIRYLPVYGQLGLRVHRGYKIFDFHNASVTKTFNENVSREQAEQEIAASKEASMISASPRFLFADSESRWFREEYVRGERATDLVAVESSDYLSYFDQATQCLLELAGIDAEHTVPKKDYLTGLADNGFSDSWIQADIEQKDIEAIERFLDRTCEWLQDNLPGQRMPLIRTHGDFSLVNAIATDSGLRIVDWEGIGPGSHFSDLLNFLFVERYYGRTSAVFADEVAELFERYRNMLLEHYPDYRGVEASTFLTARRLFYLERVALLLEREVSTNLASVVRKSIEMFDDFDAECGDVANV